MNTDSPLAAYASLIPSGRQLLEDDTLQPVDLDGLKESMAALEARADEVPKENVASRGPRNLPKPDARKRRRQRARAARRVNRS